MAIAGGDLDPVQQLNVRLRTAEILAAMTVAFLLRSGSNDQRREMLDELRRNLILALQEFNPAKDQATELTSEVAVDELLDQVVRLARIS